MTMKIKPTINGANPVTGWEGARQAPLRGHVALRDREAKGTDLGDEMIPTGAQYPASLPRVPARDADLGDEMIPTGALYPASSVVTPVLHRAFSLLEEVERALEDARRELHEDEVIAADNAIQTARAILPELFCLRSIGDGYGAVINAVQNACDHPANVPLGRPAVAAIAAAIREVRRRPFLSMDDAVELIMRIEDKGVVVEPPALQFLAGWLDE